MPLDALAPDQRAVVQLVLQRGRSYAEIAEQLKISEDAVRARAHAGLTALAPDVELPADKVAQIADFLLGQQNGKPRQATRRLLRSNGNAREWAETVRGELEDLGGRLPDLPARSAASDAPVGEDGATAAAPAEEAEPEEAPPAPRPRPRTRPVAAPATTGPVVAAPSSRLGGMLLLGGVVLAIVAVVLFLFVFGGDDDGDGESASATPTPTATAAQPNQVGQIEVRGVGSARRANGVFALFLQGQEQLLFALQVQKMPRTPSGQKYALWFAGPGNKAKWIGDTPNVGRDGLLQVQGPRQDDAARFAQDFASHRRFLITSESGSSRRRPGRILAAGDLPRN